MLKEMLEHLAQQAERAAAPKVVAPPAEAPHVYFLADPALGTTERVEATPKPRQHRARDLQAVVALALRFAALNNPVAVWHDRTKVVVLTDDATRREGCTLALELSPQLRQLQQLEAGRQAHKQLQFVLLLRTTFADCLGLAGNLLDLVRKVRFKSATDGTGTVEHGKRSVGRAVESHIQAAGDLPEYVTLDVPVFAQAFPYTAPVRCALEPDPAAETFQLIPLPGEIERAIAHGEARVGSDLGDLLGQSEDGDQSAGKIHLYYGDPNC